MSSFQIGITGTSIVFGPHITLLYRIKTHHSQVKFDTCSRKKYFSSPESIFYPSLKAGRIFFQEKKFKCPCSAYIRKDGCTSDIYLCRQEVQHNLLGKCFHHTRITLRDDKQRNSASKTKLSKPK